MGSNSGEEFQKKTHYHKHPSRTTNVRNKTLRWELTREFAEDTLENVVRNIGGIIYLLLQAASDLSPLRPLILPPGAEWHSF